jgi:phospholipid-transporting ATPase
MLCMLTAGGCTPHPTPQPQACLVYWSVVSPFKPFGPTLALVFVLLVGALKAIAEDKRRHVEDNKLNNSVAHVLNPDGEGCIVIY